MDNAIVIAGCALDNVKKLAARALRAALPLMWDGIGPQHHYRYICFALGAVGSEKPHLLLGTEYAKKEILHRLGLDPVEGGLDQRYHVMESWLAQQLGVKEKDLPKPAVQAHRKAWMQQLIDEFEGA